MEDICDLNERETDKSKTTLHSNKLTNIPSGAFTGLTALQQL